MEKYKQGGTGELSQGQKWLYGQIMNIKKRAGDKRKRKMEGAGAAGGGGRTFSNKNEKENKMGIS